MITESLKYLQKSDNALTTIIIGGLLTLASILILPVFLVFGYIVEVIKRTSTGNDEPPEFEEWGRLFTDGLQAFVIAFVYGLVPLLVGAIFIGGAVLGGIAGNGSNASGIFAGVTAVVGTLVAFVLGLAALYVIPAAIANFAEHGNLGAGFAFGELRPVLMSGTYFSGWVLFVAVFILGTVVVGFLNIIPILGTIAGLFVEFYFLVAAYYIIGHTWADVHSAGMHGDDRADEKTAV